MKKVFRPLAIITAMSIALLVGSCSEDNDATPQDLIVGNWQIASVNDVTLKVGHVSLLFYLVSEGVPQDEAQELVDLIDDELRSMNLNLEMKAGGKYSSTSDGITDTGTWELSADGKTLTMDKGTADASVVTVASVTATKLNLVLVESATEDDFTLTATVAITLTK